MTTTLYDYSIAGIKADYRKHNTGHWFDADTIRFWGTEFSETTFSTPNDGTRVYFVTCEDDFYREERLYSVRMYDFTTHEVDTISFQKDKTLKSAQLRAKFVAGA